MPYVTLIIHYVKSLGFLNLKYELLSIAIKCNLGFIAKMGYNDLNNDDDDEEKKEAPPANAPTKGQTAVPPA